MQNNKPVKLLAYSVITALITSCSVISRYSTDDYSPLVTPTESTQTVKQLDSKDAAKDLSGGEQRFWQTPSSGYKDVAHAINHDTEIKLEGEPVSLNIDSMTLPSFINEVFGTLLKQSFQIAPRLLEKKDLVTLRITDPLTPTDLFYTTKQLLETYGVAIMTEGDILHFVVSNGAQTSDAPLFVTGQALPSVPATHRPIFHVIPLKIVQNNNAVGWLKNAFQGLSLKITQDPYRNAIWLQGKMDEVKQAAEVVRILDQPLMRSRHSIRIEPLFLGAEKLVERLVEVLQAEGFDASKKQYGTINFLPIAETNSIIAFATEQSSLDHVKKWVLELDKPLKQATADNIFYYPVKNTSAENIVQILNQVDTQAPLPAANKSNSDSSSQAVSQKTNLVVDSMRNAILYKGNAEQWTALLPTIKKMDQPDLQVLVEVVVAEVKLSENFSFGIEWAINNASLSNVAQSAKDAITIGSGGLSYFPMSNSGSTRAVLNALATDSNVKLLQTPKVLVRSGQQATINVGDEVPIVTSQTTGNGQQVEGSSALTQSVQYRKTGNTLTIKPVVYSGGQVTMDIAQEISSAQPTDTSGLDSPTILNRSLQTSLSVNDGGSILIGGLIQTEDTQGESRVPFLSDIPFIGRLFTKNTINSSKTELMVLVVPYVIKNQNDAEAITTAFKNKLVLSNQSVQSGDQKPTVNP